jgi:hypothetical protein
MAIKDNEREDSNKKKNNNIAKAREKRKKH